MSCVHLESIEELVVGTIAPERAMELTAHLDNCEDCALAHAMFVEERELFARRAAVVAAPPKLQLPAPVRPHPIARLAQRAMRSQVLPALAAAFFLFAGISRMGGSSSGNLVPSESNVAPNPTAPVELATIASDVVNASYRPAEPLSCATDDTSAACLGDHREPVPRESRGLANVSAIAIAPAVGNDSVTCGGDDVAMSRGLASMCELSVTSSMSRQ